MNAQRAADRAADSLDVRPLSDGRFSVSRFLLEDYAHAVGTVLPSYRSAVVRLEATVAADSQLIAGLRERTRLLEARAETGRQEAELLREALDLQEAATRAAVDAAAAEARRRYWAGVRTGALVTTVAIGGVAALLILR